MRMRAGCRERSLKKYCLGLDTYSAAKRRLSVPSESPGPDRYEDIDVVVFLAAEKYGGWETASTQFLAAGDVTPTSRPAAT